jgi:hypothetical protein
LMPCTTMLGTARLLEPDRYVMKPRCHVIAECRVQQLLLNELATLHAQVWSRWLLQSHGALLLPTLRPLCLTHPSFPLSCALYLCRCSHLLRTAG